MYFPNVLFVLLVIFFLLKQTTSSPNCSGGAHSDPSFHECDQVSGFVLIGGQNDEHHYLDDVEVYGSFTSLPSLPRLPLPLRAHIAEMTQSGAIYMTGGQTRDDINGRTFSLPSLSSPEWREVEARMPLPVYGAASVLVQGTVLVLGGTRGGSGTDKIQMLDTSKSLPTWTQAKHRLPEPLSWHSSAVFEDKLIILTDYGVTYTCAVSSILSDDSGVDWEEGQLPGVEVGVRGPSIGVAAGSLVAVHGTKVFIKTSLDTQWEQLTDLPREKWRWPSIGTVLGNIVVAGGQDQDRASDKVLVWKEDFWGVEVNDLQLPRLLHATVQLPMGII